MRSEKKHHLQKLRPQNRPSLTAKQLQLMDFIREFKLRHGFSPSQRAVAEAMGFSSVGTVQRYKTKLEALGVLRVCENGRGLEAVDEEPLLLGRRLPLVGKVAAGLPIEAIENHESLGVPEDLLGVGEHFILQVKGDSMREEGILDGDYVVLRKQSTAQNGQIVVALVNQEATIKKYFKRANAIELHPANPEFSILTVEAGEADVQIAGVLKGVIRKIV